MNKKAILKELVKDPQIKALYNEGFDRSVVNKLIIESLMEQETSRPPNKQEISQINDIATLDKISKQWKDTQADELIAADKHRLQDLNKNISMRKREIIKSTPPRKKLAQKKPTQRVPATKQPISELDQLKSILYDIVMNKLKAIAKKYKKKINDRKAELKVKKLTNDVVGSIVKDNPDAKPAVIKNKFMVELEQFFDNEEQTAEIANTIATEPEQSTAEPNNNTGTPPYEDVRKALAGIQMAPNVQAVSQAAEEILSDKSNVSDAKAVAEVTKELSQAVDSNDKLSDEEKTEIKNDIFDIARMKVGELMGSKETNLSDFRDLLNSEELKSIFEILEAIKAKFDKYPDADDTSSLDFSDLKSKFIMSEENEKEESDFSILYDMIGFLKSMISDPGKYKYRQNDFNKMYDYLMSWKNRTFELVTTAQEKPQEEKEQIEKELVTIANDVEQNIQKLLPAPKEDPTKDDDELTGKAKEKAEQTPEFVAREAYDKAFAPVADAFYEYEEVFGTTPYLSEQSRVLFNLEDKLREFVSNKEIKQGSLGNKSDVKRTQDIKESTNAIVLVPKEDQIEFVNDYKKLTTTIKELVTLIKSLNEENITTILGMNIRKKARLKAKELLTTLAVVLKHVAELGTEEEEEVQFKESLNEEEQEQSPSDHVKRAHAQIMSNMTKMERITRDANKTQVHYEKYIDIPSKEVFSYIDQISHYFPVKAPFGKTGDLEEIKRQVRGIGLDVMDIIKKIKTIVHSGKSKQKNFATLKKTLVNAASLIENYFDLDIEDPEIRKLLPPKPKSNAAAFNDGAAEMKEKIDQLIEKYGPQIKKAYNKAKNKNETLSKVLDVVEKAVSKIANNEKLTPSIAKQVLKDILGIGSKELDKIKKDENGGILDTIIKKFEYDQQYKINDKEEKQLLKSFAKAVSGKDTKNKIRAAIMNWFNGLDPDTRFASWRNMFTENKDNSYKTAVSILSSEIKDKVERFALQLSDGRKRRVAVSEATGIMMKVIEDSEFLDNLDVGMLGQDKYQAFSSFISTINQDKESDDDQTQVRDISGDNTKTMSNDQEAENDDEDKTEISNISGDNTKTMSKGDEKEESLKSAVSAIFDDLDLDTKITDIVPDVSKDPDVKATSASEEEIEAAVKEAMKEIAEEEQAREFPPEQDDVLVANENYSFGKEKTKTVKQGSFYRVLDVESSDNLITFGISEKAGNANFTLTLSEENFKKIFTIAHGYDARNPGQDVEAEEIDLDQLNINDLMYEDDSFIEQMFDNLQARKSAVNQKDSDKDDDEDELTSQDYDDEGLGDLDHLKESKNKKIQRKLETIIEHYINQRKL